METVEKKQSLFDLAQGIVDALAAAVNPETGEMLADATAAIDALQLEFGDKVQRCACAVRIVEGEAEAIKWEIDSLKQRLETKRKRTEALEIYIQSNMEAAGVTVIDGVRRVTIAKCPPSVSILDEAAIPDEFKAREEIVKIGKDAIKAALKAGRDVPGAALITDKTRLSIK